MPQPKGCHRRGRPLCGAIGAIVGVVARLWAGLGAGLLLACAPASAQTLTEAFAYAYNNNPQLLE